MTWGQSDVLSLVMFNLAQEKMLTDLPDLKEMEIIGPCTRLANADDIILLGEFSYDVEESIRKVIKSSYKMVNENNTK